MFKLSVVEHVLNSSTQEAEGGGLLRVVGQPETHNEFQSSQGYIVRAHVSKAKATQKRIAAFSKE